MTFNEKIIRACVILIFKLTCRHLRKDWKIKEIFFYVHMTSFRLIFLRFCLEWNSCKLFLNRTFRVEWRHQTWWQRIKCCRENKRQVTLILAKKLESDKRAIMTECLTNFLFPFWFLLTRLKYFACLRPVLLQIWQRRLFLFLQLNI